MFQNLFFTFFENVEASATCLQTNKLRTGFSVLDRFLRTGFLPDGISDRMVEQGLKTGTIYSDRSSLRILVLSKNLFEVLFLVF